MRKDGAVTACCEEDMSVLNGVRTPETEDGR